MMETQSQQPNKISYQPFVIVSLPRSGSTFLESLLASHPSVLTFREIFAVRRLYPGYQGLVYLHTLLKKKNARILSHILTHKPLALIQALFFRISVHRFLSSLIFRSYPREIKAVGFKYLIPQGQRTPGLMDWVQQRKDIKSILLIRKNHLRTLISQELAHRSNQWILKNDEQNKAKDISFSLSKDYCESKLFHFEKGEQQVRTLFADQDKLVIYYADLLNNKKVVMHRIQDFLGLEKKELSSPMKKQNTRKLSEIITDYDILKQSFKGTKWNAFFDD